MRCPHCGKFTSQNAQEIPGSGMGWGWPPVDQVDLEMVIGALPVRRSTPRRLAAFDIVTLGDVYGAGDRELLSVPNFGRKGFNELRDAVAAAFPPR